MTKLSRNLAVIMLALCLSACALRPGALNKVDSAAFDVLGPTAITLEALKEDCPPATCPATKKAAINNVIRAYDQARSAWLAYRAGIRSGRSTDGTELKKALSGVSDALATYSKEIK